MRMMMGRGRRLAAGAALSLLAATGAAGCSASPQPGAAPPTAPTATSAPAPTTAPASPAPAGSTPASSPSAAPGSSGAENLVATPAVLSELTAVYAAYRQIPVADIAGQSPTHGSVYYAYDPATGKYWALAAFSPASNDPLNVVVGFQDGGSNGYYTKTGTGAWQVQGGAGICADVLFFPPAVMKAWALPTSAPGLSC